MLNSLKTIKKEEYNKRIEICKECPDVRNSIGIGLTCGVFLGYGNPVPNTCGCKLSWKAKLKTQKCPQNKWEDIE
tara:strand:+ start:248 stop:472 length:225 start_codon:yes stop_codon:yes gene_type:complete